MQEIDLIIRNWCQRKKIIHELLFRRIPLEPNDVKYSIANQTIYDYSLVVDSFSKKESILKFKPPFLLKQCQTMSFNNLKELISKFISLERKWLKSGLQSDSELTHIQKELELKHMIYLKNIVAWVLKKRGIERGQIKKLIAGDYQPDKYIQIKK